MVNSQIRRLLALDKRQRDVPKKKDYRNWIPLSFRNEMLILKTITPKAVDDIFSVPVSMLKLLRADA